MTLLPMYAIMMQCYIIRNGAARLVACTDVKTEVVKLNSEAGMS